MVGFLVLLVVCNGGLIECFVPTGDHPPMKEDTGVLVVLSSKQQQKPDGTGQRDVYANEQ